VKTARAADRAVGAAGVALGLVALAGAFGIEREAGEGLTPRAFPIAIALAIVAAGAAVIVGTARRGREHGLDWPARAGFVRIAVVLAAAAVYTAALPYLGFPLASLLLVTGLAVHLGGGGWLSALAAGAGTALVLYAVFIRLLGLALPAGPLP
jgi:putative tricarboxylic transport membrane protein